MKVNKKPIKTINLILAVILFASVLIGAMPGNYLYKADNSLPTDLKASGEATPAKTEATLGPDQYRVASGDSLQTIADSHKTTVSEIKWANNLTSDGIYQGQILEIPKKQTKSLKDILSEKGISAENADIKIVVDKSDHVIGIMSQDQLLKTYHVELGGGGLGDKQIEGDQKTPEGTLYIAEKSVLSPADQYLGTRWMRLSYPSIEDADRGLKQGLINQITHDEIVDAINNKRIPPQTTALGGGVGVHGGSTEQLGSDWTWGCIGLTSKDVEDFYDYVKVGTPIKIQN